LQAVKFALMRLLFSLIAHLLVTFARLAKPGGLGAVLAESLAVKHQLLILRRARGRAPSLTSWDRLALGVCTLLVSSRRLSRMAVILKPSTWLYFHRVLVKCKYRLLRVRESAGALDQNVHQENSSTRSSR
jgi:putative transposase